MFELNRCMVLCVGQPPSILVEPSGDRLACGYVAGNDPADTDFLVTQALCKKFICSDESQTYRAGPLVPVVSVVGPRFERRSAGQGDSSLTPLLYPVELPNR